ncbi:MAG: toxin-antitoxin system HicB family antitoxin [Desulfonauticus sp.]|nr:toxin-antitoxin system HicB family antitoxin [Desulfonauticus sp.]
MARHKVSLKKNTDEFIEGAKASEEQKEKTFLLRMPYEVWKKAKTKAIEEEKTLQQFILDAVKMKCF